MKRILSVLLMLSLLLGTAMLAIPAAAETAPTAPNFVAVQNTQPNENTQAVRFISLVSSLEGSKIGYEIVVSYLQNGTLKKVIYNDSGDEYDTTTTKVYTSIQAPDGISGGTYRTVTAADLGGKATDYLMALSIKGVPTNLGAVTFTVRAFVDVSGKKTYSEKTAFQMVDGRFVQDIPYVMNFNSASTLTKMSGIDGVNVSYDAENAAAKLVANRTGRSWLLLDVGEVDAAAFSYVVLRVKNTGGSSGVFFAATAPHNDIVVKENGADLYLAKTLEYGAGANWQNVIVDYTAGDAVSDNIDKYFTGAVKYLRIDPWENAAVGDTLLIDSVAFFRTEAQAKKYQGVVAPDPEDVAAEIANAPKLLFTDASAKEKYIFGSGNNEISSVFDSTVGMMKFTSNIAGRPSFEIANCNVDVSTYSYMAILLYTNKGAKTISFAVTESAGNIVVTGKNGGELWLDKFAFTAGNIWESAVVDYATGTEKDEYFTGILNKIRFDPWGDTAAVGDVVYIHSVAFFHTAEAANAYAASVQGLPNPLAPAA